MDITVQGKNIDIGSALKTHVEEHLEQSVNKYFNHATHATVTVSKEKTNLFKVDISINVGRGIVLQAQEIANDPYPAFDTANKILAARVKKYKSRLRDHHKRISELSEEDISSLPAKYTAFQNMADEGEAADEGDEATVIADLHVMIPTLSVSEAVMRLELSDAPALMFKNSAHGGLNMIYRRKDGHVGWVDPAGNQK
jgi:ribosomal subunit interface protein